MVGLLYDVDPALTLDESILHKIIIIEHFASQVFSLFKKYSQYDKFDVEN